MTPSQRFLPASFIFFSASLLFFTGCTTVKVDEVGPNFAKFLTSYSTVQVEDNQDGEIAADLLRELNAAKSGLDLVETAGRFTLKAELLENETDTYLNHDTQTRTVRRRDSEGRVISSRQVVDRYETTTVSRRKIRIRYTLEDSISGETLWSAEGKRVGTAERTNSSRWNYPPPLRAAEPPSLNVLARRANKGASKALAKSAKKALKAARVQPPAGPSPSAN